MSVRRLLTAGYLMLIGAALLAAALRPVAFQKSNSIRVVRGPIPSIERDASFDVYSVLAAIPTDHDQRMIWDVDPDAKYQRTIVQGRGNCSNLVFGLARHLELSGVDFQIVHLMNPSKFLAGKGHTVIRTHFHLGGRDQVGIVDIFAGGIPRSGDRYLDVDDLLGGAVPGFRFLSWGGRPERAGHFYRERLDEVEIGWIPAHEVAGYFDFVEAIYVPLGSKRLEKYVFDGLAVLFGVYPEIYVSDAMPFIWVNPLEWPFYNGALWLLRSALLLLPLLALLEWRARRAS